MNSQDERRSRSKSKEGDDKLMFFSVLIFRDLKEPSCESERIVEGFEYEILQLGNQISDNNLLIVFTSENKRTEYTRRSEWFKAIQQDSRCQVVHSKREEKDILVIPFIRKLTFYLPGTVRRLDEEEDAFWRSFSHEDKAAMSRLKAFVGKWSHASCSERPHDSWEVCQDHVYRANFIKMIKNKIHSAEKVKDVIIMATFLLKTCKSYMSKILLIDLMLNTSSSEDCQGRKSLIQSSANILKSLPRLDGGKQDMFLVNHLFNMTKILISIDSYSEAWSLVTSAKSIMATHVRDDQIKRIQNSLPNLLEFLNTNSRGENIAETEENQQGQSTDTFSMPVVIVGEAVTVLDDKMMVIQTFAGQQLTVDVDQTNVLQNIGGQEERVLSLNGFQDRTPLLVTVTFKTNLHQEVERVHIQDSLEDQIMLDRLKLTPSEDEDSTEEENFEPFLCKSSHQDVKDIEDVDDVFKELNEYLIKRLPESREAEKISKAIVDSWRSNDWFENYWFSKIRNSFNEATQKYILPEEIDVEQIRNDVNYHFNMKERFKNIRKKDVVDLTSQFMIQKAKESATEQQDRLKPNEMPPPLRRPGALLTSVSLSPISTIEEDDEEYLRQQLKAKEDENDFIKREFEDFKVKAMEEISKLKSELADLKASSSDTNGKEATAQITVVTPNFSILTFQSDEQNRLPVADVKAKHPKTFGLRFANGDNWRYMTVNDNEDLMFDPPEDGWGSRTYFIFEDQRSEVTDQLGGDQLALVGSPPLTPAQSQEQHLLSRIPQYPSLPQLLPHHTLTQGNVGRFPNGPFSYELLSAQAQQYAARYGHPSHFRLPQYVPVPVPVRTPVPVAVPVYVPAPPSSPPSSQQ